MSNRKYRTRLYWVGNILVSKKTRDRREERGQDYYEYITERNREEVHGEKSGQDFHTRKRSHL